MLLDQQVEQQEAVEEQQFIEEPQDSSGADENGTEFRTSSPINPYHVSYSLTYIYTDELSGLTFPCASVGKYF